MKKAIFLLLLLAIAFIANPATKAECPPGDNWRGPVTFTFSEGGCEYDAFICYRVDPATGFHEIAISGWIVKEPCEPRNFEISPKTVKNALIQQMVRSGYLEGLWGQVIPECPNNLCFVRWRDALCYCGWEAIKDDSTGRINHKMILCDHDGHLRSCNETVRVCWETDENGQRELKIMRIGHFSGERCADTCKVDCD